MGGGGGGGDGGRRREKSSLFVRANTWFCAHTKKLKNPSLLEIFVGFVLLLFLFLFHFKTKS